VANWLDHAVASTAELDYTTALAWFGLRFAIAEGKQQQTTWQLLFDTAASQEYLARLQLWAFDKDVA
jgi:hypothetical protein